MKLKNKHTGEIVEVNGGQAYVHCGDIAISFSSLDQLNSTWEDVTDEPKEYWYLENDGDIDKEIYDGDAYEERMIEIGNYFETEEEAELAVRKLKAWKRLKDKGFRFERWCFSKEEPKIIIKGNCVPDIVEELDLLFSGGEE